MHWLHLYKRLPMGGVTLEIPLLAVIFLDKYCTTHVITDNISESLQWHDSVQLDKRKILSVLPD